MKKIKLVTSFLLLALIVSGCNKGTKSERFDTTEQRDVLTEVIEDKDNDYQPRTIREETSTTATGPIQVAARLNDLNNFYVNPMRYDINDLQNLVVIRTAPENIMSGKVFVYSPDWRYRTTPIRGEAVTEYVVSKNENDEYYVQEIRNETESVIPLNGFVISIPQSVDYHFEENEIVNVEGITFSSYKSAIYNQKGVRRGFSQINNTYFNDYNSIAAFFDSTAASDVTPYPNSKINYIRFGYDNQKRAFTPKFFRTKFYTNNSSMNLEEGFVLTNVASSSNPSAVVLEEGVCFSEGDSIYFEQVPQYYQNTFEFNVGSENMLIPGIYFTPYISTKHGEKTGANEWAYEFNVVNNRIVSHSVNEIVPENGFTITARAGSGNSIEQITKALHDIFKIGAHVTLSNNNKHITLKWDAPDMAPYVVNDTISTIQQYIDLRNEQSHDYDSENLKKIQNKVNDIYAKMQKLSEESLDNVTNQYHFVNMLSQIELWKNNALLLVSGNHEPVFNQSLWCYAYESTLEEIQKRLDMYVESNINEIIVGPIDDGYALYDSKYLSPVTYRLQNRNYGKYGTDYLKAVVAEAHKRNIKVQAIVNQWSHWRGVVERYPEFEDYFALNIHGEKTQDTMDGLSQYLDPANPKVQELYLNVYKEILDKYDVDGLQLDGIRYGASNDYYGSSQGITEAARKGFNAFLQSQGSSIQYANMELFRNALSNQTVFLQFNEYRRSVVTGFVSECHDLVHSYGKVITAAVVAGLEYARRGKLQAWDEWGKKGIVDGIYLMSYYLDSDYVESSALEAYQTCGSTTFVVSGISPVYSGLPNMQLSLQLKDVSRYGAVGGAIFANHSYGGRTNVPHYLNGKYGGAFDLKSVTTYEKLSVTMKTLMDAILRRSNLIYQPNQQQTKSQYNALLEATNTLKKVAKGKQNQATIEKVMAEITKMKRNCDQYASSYAQTRILESLDYAYYITSLYSTYMN